MRLFRNKNFALLFTGTLVSNIGTMFYNFAVGWFILTLTQSPFQAGMYIAFGSIVQLLATPLAGIYVDRLSKVKILVITDYIRGLTVLVGALLIFWFNQESFILITLYTVTLVLGLNAAFFGPAQMSLTPEIVPDENLNQANALFGFLRSFQAIIGVLLAGLFYATLGIVFIFVFNGVSFILSGVSEMFIRSQRNVPAHTNTSLSQDFKEGLTYIRQKEGFVAFLMVILFLNFAVSPFFANVLPVFFNLEMEQEPIMLSGVQIAFSIGAMLGGLSIASFKAGLKVDKTLKRGITGMTVMLVFSGLLLHAALMEWLTFGWFYLLFMVGCFFLAFINMFVNVPLQTSLMRIVDESMRGRVLSVLEMLTQGLIPLAIALTGFLLEFYSLSMMMLGLILVMLVPYVILMFYKPIQALLSTI